ncbi:hypothetical protein F5B19DRAFT_200458 [Rostrohypoxylon terebratum]|nr:hypothetical protein F5B19DRAFT_200458 [Rostrohypoxylon terebratum]
MPQAKSQKYYAICTGRTPGIYRSATECRAQTSGYPGAKCKAFSTQDYASAWLTSTSLETTSPTTTAATVKKNQAKATRYYAVAVGWTPGIYMDSALALASHLGYKGAKCKRFNTCAEAEVYMRMHNSSNVNASSYEDRMEEKEAEDGGLVRNRDSNSIDIPTMPTRSFMLSVYQATQSEQREPNIQASSGYGIKREDSPISFVVAANGDLPAPWAQPPSPVQPPPSSFFTQFQDFTPNNSIPFDDEFNRCMSSQGIAPRTAEYRRQRTRAIRHEIKFHYSSQQPANDVSLSQIDREQAQRLQVYQNMCRAVRLPVHSTENACVVALKEVLVNIVDYVDAIRMERPVEVWTDFAAFRKYTLSDDKRFDSHEARADGGFLAVLLRRLRCPRDGRRKRKRESEMGTDRVKRERME